MFANFAQLVTGQSPSPPTGRNAFVEEVRVDDGRIPHRDPRVVRLIAWCWLFIAIKHVAVIWAVWRFHVPFHQLWVNFPTWMLGVLATMAYYLRTRRA